jgi:acid stress-induced BolA-like protein IbaG/YrbA
VQAEDVKGLLETGLENCEVSVDGDGSHFNLLVVGEVFAGLRPVKRQQLVYAVLSEQIADGSIHAVNMRTFTADEWRQQPG